VLTEVTARVLDLVGALLALLLLSPVLLLTAVAVKVTSRGPVLFRQTRLGRDARPFVMFKFRTMRTGCSDSTHRDYVTAMLRGEATAVDGLYKLPDDTRITPVGAFLRRTSIDELPQLWNVLRGRMSLVGPRPVLPWEAELFPEWAAPRYGVRPGVTGLWQVSGRNRLTMQEGLALDVQYVARRGLPIDLLILVRTVAAVLRGGAR
jgi:lipopolysaccharide/colanic/teichoic acid biosynthesis glycosyltransferase